MHAFALILTTAALWFALSGFLKPLLLTFGVVSVLAVYLLSRRFGAIDDKAAPWRIMLAAPLYWFWLFVEIGKANFVVVRAALSRDAAISPTMITASNRQKSDVGIATFANSITLTPGTVTVSIDGDTAQIHALTEDLADPTGLAAMGARVAKLDEALSEAPS